MPLNDIDGLAELRARDARIKKWLENVMPGDTVTVGLNKTDTLTGKVYEVEEEYGTSLCVWTTVLRHANGIVGDSYEPMIPEHILMQEGSRFACSVGDWSPMLGESVRRAFDKHLLEVRDAT